MYYNRIKQTWIMYIRSRYQGDKNMEMMFFAFPVLREGCFIRRRITFSGLEMEKYSYLSCEEIGPGFVQVVNQPVSLAGNPSLFQILRFASP